MTCTGEWRPQVGLWLLSLKPCWIRKRFLKEKGFLNLANQNSWSYCLSPQTVGQPDTSPSFAKQGLGPTADSPFRVSMEPGFLSWNYVPMRPHPRTETLLLGTLPHIGSEGRVLWWPVPCLLQRGGGREVPKKADLCLSDNRSQEEVPSWTEAELLPQGWPMAGLLVAQNLQITLGIAENINTQQPAV